MQKSMENTDTGTAINLLEIKEMLVELNRKLDEVPSSETLWSVVEIAQYTRRKTSTVHKKYLPRPDFPQPIRLLGTGHPLFDPSDIKRWVRQYKERK